MTERRIQCGELVEERLLLDLNGDRVHLRLLENRLNLAGHALLIPVMGNLHVDRADDRRRRQLPEVLVGERDDLVEFENTIEHFVLHVRRSLEEKRHGTVFQQRQNREKDHDGYEQRADRIRYVPAKELNE